MKRAMICSIVMAGILTAGASFAAQQSDQFENEFKSFREKLDAARDGKSGAKTTPAAADDKLVVPLDGVAAAPDTAMPANPLGPAANLPLDKNAAPVMSARPPAAPQTPEEMQAMMEADAAEQQKKIEQQTFDAALKSLMPMSTEQIRATYEAFKINRRAAETPAIMPEPKQVVETVSLDPSDALLSIKAAPGYVTTVLFLDASGAPWPIQDITWAGKFSIASAEAGGNILRVIPQTAHGVGNISIRLVDLNAPITMNLRTGIDEVYYRMDVRVPKAGPLAKTPLIEYGGLSATAGRDDAMVSVLDGTPPEGAEKMKVDGVDGRTVVWKLNDKVYVRTPLTLLSPGWQASASSADGTNVYAFGSTPVMLLSDNGRMVRAKIGDNEATP